MTELILLEGDQLEIDLSKIGFELDKSSRSLCPKCSGQIIELSSGCKACGWQQEEKLLGDKCSFKQRVTVERCDLKWAQDLVTKHHYLHRPIHPRSLPFAYSISLDGLIIGTIIMATIHYTKKKGLFGYDGLPTKWQVLQIARLWIDPKYQERQVNGHANNIASCAIAKMLKRVNRDWLEHHPPRDLTQPYEIELILSYADTGVGHEGTIYKAANFERFGETTSNRSRHGTYKGSSEPKILYVYRLNRRQKKQCPQKLLGDNLSIPCEIKEPHKEPIDGLIICDRGDKFDVLINDRVLPIAKLYVHPKLLSPKKCRTDQDIPPSKKRRNKGENSGSIFIKPVKRGSKTYKQYWFKYEEWINGKRIGKSRYIPKTSLAKVKRMNQERRSPKAILDFLNGKSRRKKK